MSVEKGQPGAAPRAAIPPWLREQRQSLLAQRGHAWLLQGPSGLGQYELAMELVRTWLCDHPGPDGACGTCASCHAIDVRTHADLCVLMPETAMVELNWPISEKAQSEIDDKKRKASREIRVEAMRDAVEFVQRTSGRGQGKAVLVFPAERMNNISANALLKTLEEPPPGVRFVLATDASHLLLPTIRSRCMAHAMAWPATADALAWLQEKGVPADEGRVLLAAAGGRPDDALTMAQAGLSAKGWAALPKAVKRGEVTAFSDWAPAQAIVAMHKICHDLLAAGQGAAPRFFGAADLPEPVGVGALTRWSKELQQSARVAEHPLNAGLMLESLVARGQMVLNSRP